MRRSLRLAKVATQAEGLRLRRMIQRQAYRGVYGAIAAVFAIALLSMAHIALYLWMFTYVSSLAAVGIVAAVDLVFAAIFGFMASRDSPDSVELEATRVRDTARAQLTDVLTLTTLVGPAMRMGGVSKITSLAVGAMAARYLANRRK